MRGRGESTAGIAEFTRDALERGATLLAGGTRIGDSGNFWQPTVLADVPLDARIFNDEPFGPMAGIRTFDTLDEAIAEANRLPYGLAATDVDRRTMSDPLGFWAAPSRRPGKEDDPSRSRHPERKMSDYRTATGHNSEVVEIADGNQVRY